jgi:Protein of unknown function (DUF2867)
MMVSSLENDHMNARPVAVELQTLLLPDANFADCYQLELSGQNLDAEGATRRVMGRNPLWIARLMKLRNVLVAPLGLKAAPDERLGVDRSIGTFPLVSKSQNRVVLGLDDRHLDFRVVVDVVNGEGGRQLVSATTYVKTHNALGRLYLWLVTPFHRIIVPTMLAQAARA